VAVLRLATTNTSLTCAWPQPPSCPLCAVRGWQCFSAAAASFPPAFTCFSLRRFSLFLFLGGSLMPESLRRISRALRESWAAVQLNRKTSWTPGRIWAAGMPGPRVQCQQSAAPGGRDATCGGTLSIWREHRVLDSPAGKLHIHRDLFNVRYASMGVFVFFLQALFESPAPSPENSPQLDSAEPVTSWRACCSARDPSTVRSPAGMGVARRGRKPAYTDRRRL